MKKLIMSFILAATPLSAATIALYNGETAKFSAATTWDSNGSTLVQSTSAPYSKPNHLRATIKVKNWWGAVAYVPANWNSVNLSGASALTMAAKSPTAKKLSVALYDGNNATSAKVDISLASCYLETSIPISKFTGVNLADVRAVIFFISDGTTASYLIDIDNLAYVSDAMPSPTPTPSPTPSPTPTPTPTPIPTGDNEAVRVKAAALAQEMTGKPYIMVGEGGLDPKPLGLKPAIHYRYLVEGWRTWNAPDGYYADMVINQAKEISAVPMFTYYQLAYQFEVKNYGILTSGLHQYLLDMRVLLQHIATGNVPTILHIEPDFYGYLQQYAVSINTPAASIPAKVKASDLPECSAVSENVGGMFSCIIKMARAIAPKTKLGFHASSWGDWYDSTDPNAPLEAKAVSVGNFLKSIGSDQTDFIAVDPCDRDAGFWEVNGRKNVYLDETNQTLPNFAGWIKWSKIVGQTMVKPIMHWQIPFGVPSSTPGGTDGHYRDNRVHYFFSHMNDLAASGVFAMAYGAGADRQTTPATDGGQFKTALDAYLTATTDLTKR